MQPLRVGIVGVGNISGIYLRNLRAFDATEVVAVADLDADRARAVADANGVPLALTPSELIAHPEVDLVLNLTIPGAHGGVALDAVRAGKHVYNEKPLTVDLDEARLLVETAKDADVRVGGAPDTFLGQGVQTAVAALDAGLIGAPLAATAAMRGRGHESWHPSPAFYYQRGGGPMLDMGPYYVTALVALLGPAKRVAGMVRAGLPTRTSLSGETIAVETPTHLAGTIEYAGGAIAELTTSFDVYHGWGNALVVYGTEGTMRVPDPNNFGGAVEVRRGGDAEWSVAPPRHAYAEDSRGLGVLDMAHAIREGRPHRASGDLALHALETMLAFERSSDEGRHVLIESRPSRPEPMPIESF